MGGSGSGNFLPRAKRPTTGASKRLDLRMLRRAGALELGRVSSIDWDDGGTWFVLAEERALQVKTARGADPVTLDLDATPCRFGGRRAWLVCPACGTRRVVLAHAGDGFVCRGCARLAYATSQERDVDRLLSKVHRLHRRMGGTGSLFECPPRPKGMHEVTYRRLHWRWLEAKHEMLAAALARA